jgi:hypothetical protein
MIKDLFLISRKFLSYLHYMDIRAHRYKQFHQC